MPKAMCQKTIDAIKSKGFEVLNRLQSGKYRFLCFCGKEFSTIPYKVTSGHTQSCGCIKGIHRRRGTKNVSITYFNSVKYHAEIRNYIFDIDIEFISKLLIKQKFKCALSGMDIKAGYPKDGEITASLDRIDNNKGYTKDNVQWVHKDINWMKQDFNQEYFVYLCIKVAKGKND